MNTQEIMALSLKMASFKEIPADSVIYHPGSNLKRAIIGIDMETPELLLAKQLGYDVVIAHHPVGGTARLNFAEVLRTHLMQMLAAGVPESVARPIVEAKIAATEMAMHSANYDHAPSMARLLNMPYLNVHLPLDEIGRVRMVAAIADLRPESPVSVLIAAFKEQMGEFRNALTDIQVRVGSLDNPIGKVVISHAAGTNGGYEIAKAYFDHGIDTVLYIHCSPQDSQRLYSEYQGKGKNLIISGHIASDSVGINLFITELEKRGLEVTRASGVISP